MENLKIAGINYAMIYFQAHVGLCYFPTKHGDIHKAVVENPEMIRRTVDLCRENDIRVCGYYSLIYNTREHDKRPNWRMVGPDGLSSRERGSGDDNMDFVSLKLPDTDGAARQTRMTARLLVSRSMK